MSDNPFRDRLRQIEAREKMNNATNIFVELIITGHNLDLSLDTIENRLMSLVEKVEEIRPRVEEIEDERERRNAVSKRCTCQNGMRRT
jgi:hypothetical protein